MNKTKIEWTDYTWNPVTGCWGPGGTAEKPNRCWYCYAQKISNRFPEKYFGVDPFAPRFWADRLNNPAKVKKPSRIFVGSICDLFGDWVPEDWIIKILFSILANAPHHTYQFLTKNPKRLQAFDPWPSNCWVGTTVTNQDDADERLSWLLKVDASVRFVSHEPLLSEINLTVGGPGLFPWDTAKGKLKQETANIGVPYFVDTPKINWAIIGAMTGPGYLQHLPQRSWIQSLINQCRAAGMPIFLKSNLNWLEKIQEWPG